MEKPHPNENRLQITVYFRPASGGTPPKFDVWQRNCEKLFNELRSYLIAQV